jgi:hypothetical protein
MKEFGVSPLKFRAWDEQNKTMHYDFEFITSRKDDRNDVFEWIVFKSDKQPLSGKPHPFDNPFFIRQLKISQFTGLKDQTGKDIYGGDVLEFQDGRRAEVYWSEDNASFEFGPSLKPGVPHPFNSRIHFLATVAFLFS